MGCNANRGLKIKSPKVDESHFSGETNFGRGIIRKKINVVD